MLLRCITSRRSASVKGIAAFSNRREMTVVVSNYEQKWRELVVKETKKAPEDLETLTPEGLVLKPVYTAADLPMSEESLLFMIPSSTNI